jgi:hypothetical protein
MSSDYVAALGGGPTAPPQANSLGMGQPPNLPSLPPPPTGKGAMPTGGAGGTRLTAAGEAIAALRNFMGFAPNMSADITSMIAQIKDVTRGDAQANGPAIGQPGTPGSAQMDSSQTLDSGSPGPM